ncbi:MAG: hypothetical protein AB7C96_01935 [Hydrogenovibrio sp.]
MRQLSGWKVLLGLCLTGAVQAAEPKLERLFYTPDQRAHIEQARQAYLNPEVKPSQRSSPVQNAVTPTQRKPKVSAIIVLPDGQRQVRVNGRYQSLSDNRVQLDARGNVAKSNGVE